MTAAELLAASGRFPRAPGRTGDELTAIEAEFGFSFAADHRAFGLGPPAASTVRPGVAFWRELL